MRNMESKFVITVALCLTIIVNFSSDTDAQSTGLPAGTVRPSSAVPDQTKVSDPPLRPSGSTAADSAPAGPSITQHRLMSATTPPPAAPQSDTSAGEAGGLTGNTFETTTVVSIGPPIIHVNSPKMPSGSSTKPQVASNSATGTGTTAAVVGSSREMRTATPAITSTVEQIKNNISTVIATAGVTSPDTSLSDILTSYNAHSTENMNTTSVTERVGHSSDGPTTPDLRGTQSTGALSKTTTESASDITNSASSSPLASDTTHASDTALSSDSAPTADTTTAIETTFADTTVAATTKGEPVASQPHTTEAPLTTAAIRTATTSVPTDQQTHITSMAPTYGPLAGGTVISITGVNMPHPAKLVWLGDGTIFKVLVSTASLITVETPFVDQFYIDRPLQIIITFSDRNIYRSSFNFVYRPNPTITNIQPLSTIPQGGLTLTVHGIRLDASARPELRMFVMSTSIPTIPMQMLNSDCDVHNSTELHCITPRIDMTPQSESCENTTDCGYPSLEDMAVHIGVTFDGFIYYTMLSLIPTLSDYGLVEVVPAPIVQGGQTFYYNKNPVEFQIIGFQQCCSLADVVIHIGYYYCTGVTLDNTTMSCWPPPHPPPRESGISLHEAYRVTMNIGRNTEYYVGDLVYETRFEEYLIIICAIIGFILTIIWLSCCISCVRKTKKTIALNKAKKELKKSRDLEMIELKQNPEYIVYMPSDGVSIATTKESRDMGVQVDASLSEYLGSLDPSSDDEEPPVVPAKLEILVDDVEQIDEDTEVKQAI